MTVSELTFEQFAQIAPLFNNNFRYDWAWLDTAFREKGRARAFVTQGENQTALLGLNSGEWFIAGQASGEAVQSLLGYVRSLTDKPVLVFLSLPEESWRKLFRGGLAASFEEITRVDYTFKPDLFQEFQANQPALADNLAINRLDEALSHRVAQEVDPDFNDFWPDYTNFLARGLGYAITQQNQLCSVAYSAFVPYRHLEIAVATAPAFRGQNLAKLVSAALIAESLARKIEPHWTTEISNLASQQTAKKLGFRNEEFHYWLKSKQA